MTNSCILELPMRIIFCVIVQKQILLLLNDDSNIWLRSDGFMLCMNFCFYDE